MILESIAFIFVVALIRRYNFINAQDFPQKGVVFPLLFVVLQFINIAMVKKGMAAETFRTLNLIGFSLFYLYFGLNWKYKGILLMTLGVSLNLLPMILNGGTMPVDPYYFRMVTSIETYEATFEGYNLMHSLVDQNTVLAFLGDVIPLMPPYPFPKLISIGDITLGVGFCWLALSTLRGDYAQGEKEKEEEEEEIKIFPRLFLHRLRDGGVHVEKEESMEDTKPHGDVAKAIKGVEQDEK